MDQPRPENWQASRDYYDRAIAHLAKAQEELQEELKSLREIKVSYDALQSQFQLAQQEIKELKQKLRTTEEILAATQQTTEQSQSRISSNQKATHYLYEQIQAIQRELQEEKQDFTDVKEKVYRVQELVILIGKRVSQLSDEILFVSKTSGTNYKKLNTLLQEGQWKKADLETRKIMLKIVGREKEGSFKNEHISKLPCEDLRIINRLWREYSNENFGFTVQQSIWYECGKDWSRWGDKVGWRRNGEWIIKDEGYDGFTFDINAPRGHLPLVKDRVMLELFTRLSKCEM